MIRAALRLLLPVISLVTVIAALPTHASASMAIQQGDSASISTAQESLFSDSFDSTGDLSLWSGDHMLTVEEQAGYQASYGAHGISMGTPAFIESRLRQPALEVYARIRFTSPSRETTRSS